MTTTLRTAEPNSVLLLADGTVIIHRHGGPPFLSWATVDPDGTARRPTPIPGLDRPTVFHQATSTEHWVVVIVPPLFVVADPSATSFPLLSWEPADGTRIALIPRDGGPVRWCTTDAFVALRILGAVEIEDPVAGDPVVLDYLEHDRPDRIPVPGHRSSAGRGRLCRATIDPASGAVSRELIDPPPRVLVGPAEGGAAIHHGESESALGWQIRSTPNQPPPS